MRTLLLATAALVTVALPQVTACSNDDCTVTKTCPVGSSGQGGDDTSSQGGGTTSSSQGGATSSQGGAGGSVVDTCGNELVDAGELCFTEDTLYFDIGGSEPYDILLYDCSGDDRLDVIVAQDGSQALIIMENSGSGTFPLSATRSVVSPPVTLAIGNTSGPIQGPELIVGYTGGGYTDTNRIGAGCQITYEYPLYHTGMAGRPEVEVGDVVEGSTEEIIILHNNRIFYRGTDNMALERILAGGPKAGLALADIDGDNNQDVVMVDPSVSALEVYRTSVSSGTPYFPSAPTQALPTGTSPTDTAAGDLDGDGDADIVVTNGGGNSLSVYINNSASGISLTKNPIDIAVGGQPVFVKLADLDNDDDLDIIVANYESSNDRSSLTLLLNDGIGNFVQASGSPLAIAARPLALEVADVNIDGAPDILTSSALGSGPQAQLSVIRSMP